MAEDKNKKADKYSLELRKALNDAYAFVAGSQSVAEFSEFTVEKAHEQFIERVQGSGTKLRPNVLGQIDQIASKLLTAIESIKSS